MLGGEELYAGGVSHPFDVVLDIGEFVPCDEKGDSKMTFDVYGAHLGYNHIC